MVLFEIHQRFKGQFLNELCVSFKEHYSKKICLKNFVQRQKVTGDILKKLLFIRKIIMSPIAKYFKSLKRNKVKNTQKKM